MRKKHWDGSRRDGRELQREIGSAEFVALLGRAQKREPYFARFSTWDQLVQFMRVGVSDDPEKDLVLRALFEAHREDADPAWRHILLVLFWPGLETIFRQRRRWDNDPEELWQAIIWAFLKVICRIDPAARPSRLAKKIFTDTVRAVYDESRKQHRFMAAVTRLDLEELDEFIDAEDIDFATIERNEKEDAAIARLRGHLASGHINEADFLLLVGTRVYGRSLADYARDTGSDYQTAKQRRLRAEKTIRKANETAE